MILGHWILQEKKSQRGDNVGPSLARGCRNVGVFSIFFIFYQFLTFSVHLVLIDLNCFKDATKMHTKILFRLDHGHIYLLNSLQTVKQTIDCTNCLFTICVRCSMYLQTVAVCTIVHALMRVVSFPVKIFVTLCTNKVVYTHTPGSFFVPRIYIYVL